MSLRRAMPSLLILLSLWALAGAVPADSGEPRGPFLWEVSGPNGPSFLFGTVHIGVSLDDLDPIVRRKLDATSKLMTETDIDQMDVSSLVAYTLLPDDQSLDKMLGPELWKKLLAQVDGELSEDLLKQARPWIPTMGLLGGAGTPSLKQVSLERELEAIATKTGKQLSFFEAAFNGPSIV